MHMLLRILGCLFVVAGLAGLALQHPTVTEAMARGHDAEAQGDWAQALAWYAQASQSRPDDAAPFTAGARLRLWGGRADRAEHDWGRAVACAPRSADLWLLGGDIALAEQDPITAVADYQRAITLAPASATADEAAMAQARLAFDAGDAARVPRIVREIAAPTPALRALLAIALAHQGLGDAAQALLADPAVAHALAPDARVALTNWGGTARDLAALGYADLTAGWPRLALDPLRHAVAAQPSYGAGQAYLAWALWQTGDVATAQMALAEAERLAPDAPLTIGIAAELRAARGDAAGALATLVAWQGRHAPTPELWGIQVHIAALSGDWASEEEARWQLATAPVVTDHASALLELAAFYLRTRLGVRDGHARWAVAAAMAANPVSAQAEDLRGQWAWQTGQPDVAITAFRVALAHDPRYAPAHAHLALVAWALGDGTSARMAAAQALALDASSITIWRGTTFAVTPDDSLAL